MKLFKIVGVPLRHELKSPSPIKATKALIEHQQKGLGAIGTLITDQFKSVQTLSDLVEFLTQFPFVLLLNTKHDKPLYHSLLCTPTIRGDINSILINTRLVPQSAAVLDTQSKIDDAAQSAKPSNEFFTLLKDANFNPNEELLVSILSALPGARKLHFVHALVRLHEVSLPVDTPQSPALARFFDVGVQLLQTMTEAEAKEAARTLSKWLTSTPDDLLNKFQSITLQLLVNVAGYDPKQHTLWRHTLELLLTNHSFSKKIGYRHFTSGGRQSHTEFPFGRLTLQNAVVSFGKFELFETLFKKVWFKGAGVEVVHLDPITHVDIQYRSSLMVAASVGATKIGHHLISTGSTPDYDNEHFPTPLIIALRNGHFEFAKMLLVGVKKPFMRYQDSSTPVYWVARSTATITGKNGESPLFLLVRTHRIPPVLDFLETVSEHDPDSFDVLFDTPVPPAHNPSWPKSTPIGHYMIRERLPDMFQKLVKVINPRFQYDDRTISNPLLTAIDGEKNTIFHAAVQANCDPALTVVKTLQAPTAGEEKMGYALELPHIDAKNKSGKTALIIAAEKGLTETIALLHSMGAKLDQHFLGKTLVHLFVEHNHPVSSLRQLLTYLTKTLGTTALSALINTPDNSGNTPLSIAAERGSQDSTITELLRYRANPTIKANGKTPAQIAAAKGYTKTAQLLLKTP